MPEKPRSTRAAAPVYSMSHDDQVDLLAQALLREYMHRKGFSRTMAAFDSENPRNARTINSRAVMGDMMHLGAERQAVLKGEGAETVMEMLCFERATKRERLAAVEEMRRRLQELPDDLPPSDAKPHKKEKKKKEKKSKRSKGEGDDAVVDGKKEKEKKKKKEKEKARHKMLSIDDLLEKDTTEHTLALAEQRRRHEERLARERHALFGGSSDEDGESSAASRNRAAGQRDASSASPAAATPPSNSSVGGSGGTEAKAPATAPIFSQRQSARSSTSGGSGNDENDDRGSASDSDTSGSSGSDSSEDYDAALRRLREEARGHSGPAPEGPDSEKSPRRRRGEGWHSPAGAEPGNSAQPHSDPNGHDAGNSRSPQRRGPPPVLELPPNAVGEGDARALLDHLVGPDRVLPAAFTAQGFFFSSDVEYGLVQSKGGPCGVLAVVQAYLLRELYENHFVITEDARRGALCRALVRILLHIQPKRSARHVVLLSYEASAAAVTAGLQARSRRQQIAAIGAMARGGGYDDEQKLLAAVDALVAPELWLAPDGPGLLAFILSCVITRGGVVAVESDMDIASPLIAEHDYCSQELTNLCLCGRAFSNVHDGTVTHGSLRMQGFVAQLDVGFVSHMEHRKLLTVGDHAKRSKYPIWIVFNESHYTVMFMKGGSPPWASGGGGDEGVAGTGESSFELFYYDQQGGQDAEIRLTIRQDKLPLPAVGRHELTPYLNDVIRTLPGLHLAKIDWNGTDPLL